MATRHQRRKAVRARKDAKAERLNTRAMRVLQEERKRHNLSGTRRRFKCWKPKQEIIRRNKAGEIVAWLTVIERVTEKPSSTRGLHCRGFGTDKVHCTVGAHGKRLFDVANEEVGKGGKPNRRAHSSFDRDQLAQEGAGLNPEKVRARYAETLSRSGYPKRDDEGYLQAPKRFAK